MGGGYLCLWLSLNLFFAATFVDFWKPHSYTSWAVTRTGTNQILYFTALGAPPTLLFELKHERAMCEDPLRWLCLCCWCLRLSWCLWFAVLVFLFFVAGVLAHRRLSVHTAECTQALTIPWWMEGKTTGGNTRACKRHQGSLHIVLQRNTRACKRHQGSVRTACCKGTQGPVKGTKALHRLATRHLT